MLPYYKIITVPNLEQISHELDQALPDLIVKRFNLKDIYSFNLVDVVKLLELAPALGNWLDTIGLKNNISFAGFPWAAPSSMGPIHTDGWIVDAINLPVYNCEKGYSVWYRGHQTVEEKIVHAGDVIVNNHQAEYVPYALPRQRLHLTQVMTADGPELARVSNRYPVWYNTRIPHRGINFSDQPRITFTVRFNCPLDVDAL